MKLSSLMIKNTKHNIRNYMAYLLGNSFIQCILLMFLSLIFSKEFINYEDVNLIKDNLNLIVSFMLAFSVVFIMYTTISFTKYRGQEFGVYYTIGLTSKDIIKILFYENIIVSSLSFFIGIFLGTVFSKLFFLTIEKVLNLNNVNITMNFTAYLVIFSITIGIFMFNTIYQIIFLKKHSVINIIKSTSNKDVGKGNTFIGILGLIMLISSLIIFNRTLNNNFKNVNLWLGITVGFLLISLYLVIGSSMTLVEKISKLFPEFHNNNILVLNSLSYKFKEYRTILYVVTLLVIGSIATMSISYSQYMICNEQNRIFFPQDISIIVNKEERENNNFKKIIEESGGKVDFYYELESITSLLTTVEEENVIGDRIEVSIIDEKDYNRLTNNNIDLKNNEVVYVNKLLAKKDLDTGLILDYSKDKNFENIGNLKEREEKNDSFFYFSKENVNHDIDNFINKTMTEEVFYSATIIVKHDMYNKIKENTVEEDLKYNVIANLKNNNKYKEIRKEITPRLEEINKKITRTLTISEEELENSINESGFTLFTSTFLGVIFLMGSCVVLYFKIFTSVNQEKKRYKQLIGIGLTKKEINRTIILEMSIIFLVPIVLAVSLVGYFISSIGNQVDVGNLILESSINIFLLYVIMQLVFLIMTLKKYLREVKCGVD